MRWCIAWTGLLWGVLAATVDGCPPVAVPTTLVTAPASTVEVSGTNVATLSFAPLNVRAVVVPVQAVGIVAVPQTVLVKQRAAVLRPRLLRPLARLRVCQPWRTP